MRNVNRTVIDHRSRRVSCPRLKWTRSKSAVAPCGASGAGWMRRDERLYSGLTDDDVQKFQGLDILDLAAAQPEHQEITLLFLAGHEKAFREALASIEKAAKTKHPTIYHLACAEDFDQLFEAIIAVAHTNVFNLIASGAGGKPPQALWGRTVLYSRLHCSTSTAASANE